MSSHKKKDWKEYPFLTEKGLEVIRMYSTPHTAVGMGMYASYKNFGEDFWRIGYESKTLKGRVLGAKDKVTKEEIEEQLIEDLKLFSQLRVFALGFVFLKSFPAQCLHWVANG